MLEIDTMHVVFAIINVALLVLIALWLINFIKSGTNRFNADSRIEEKLDRILEKLDDKN